MHHQNGGKIRDQGSVALHVFTQLSKHHFVKCQAQLQDAKVEVMAVYPNISKTVVARVVRCNNHSKLFSGYDYIVDEKNHSAVLTYSIPAPII